MNTINFTLALLALMNSAFVLYLLKYVYNQRFDAHRKDISLLFKELDNLINKTYEVQFNDIETRVEENSRIYNLERQVKELRENKTTIVQKEIDFENAQEQQAETKTEVIKPPRKPRFKRDSLRKIKNQELEEFFLQKTGLTFRGYVIKYGQEEFKAKKHLIYNNLHYRKFRKKV